MSKKKKTQRKARSFVLDGSVTLAWFFEDETDAYAASVENSFLNAAATVPSLWHLEIANALIVGERRKRTTPAKSAQFLQLLKGLPITADDQTALRAWDETVLLARTHDLSVYDASYLELAIRRALPLASNDKQLNAAASEVGIILYSP